MAIKNVMIETNQVTNFAVCCTANLTIEVNRPRPAETQSDHKNRH
jgi:hypothetical protein